jgi:hypothetical protein
MSDHFSKIVEASKKRFMEQNPGVSIQTNKSLPKEVPQVKRINESKPEECKNNNL